MIILLHQHGIQLEVHVNTYHFIKSHEWSCLIVNSNCDFSPMKQQLSEGIQHIIQDLQQLMSSGSRKFLSFR